MASIGLGVQAADRNAAAISQLSGEVRSVVSVMRRNAKWSLADHAEPDVADPLTESFQALRRKLYTWGDIATVSPMEYLSPFLDVCRSEAASGPITGAALNSLYAILSSSLLRPEAPGAVEAIHAVADAVAHCRFEATDPAHDDTVLARIMSVLLAALRCPLGHLLSDDHVCAMVYATYHIGHHTGRESALLVHVSRTVLAELVRTVFSRACAAPGSQQLLAAPETPSALATRFRDGQPPSSPGNRPGKPYGMSAACDIFSFIISLIAYDDEQHGDELASAGLALAGIVIESGGASFAEFPPLLALLREDLSRALIAVADFGSPSVISSACGLIVTIYMRFRPVLKIQLELWLTFVILPLAEGGSATPFEVQRAALEALADLCRQPTFITDLFCNYDCDIRCPNLFARTAALLCKSAFPVSGPMMATHSVALEALLSVLAVLAERSPGPEQQTAIDPPPPLADPTTFDPAIWDDPPGPTREAAAAAAAGDLRTCALHLRMLKYLKERIAVGADHFNRDAKKGVQFLTTISLLPTEPSCAAMACFLRFAFGLDKTAIGDYLGEKDAFAVAVLDHFATLFDFKGLNLERALRLFLDAFRLPGESQKIERCMEAFAARYYDANVGLPTGISANADAACVLSYSTIMLNTDLHSTQVKKKMTLEEFKRNNRGTNNKQDWPAEYLTDIYNSIASDAIKMTDSLSHGGGRPKMSMSQWVVSTRAMARGEGALLPLPATGPGAVVLGTLLDKELFSAIWGPAIAAISVVFDHAEEGHVLREAVGGFHAVARVAAAHRLDVVMDHQIATLCKFVHIPTGPQAVAQLAADTKVPLALATIFGLAHKYGDTLRAGWGNIIECLLRLQRINLLADGLGSDPESGEGLSVAAIRARCRPDAGVRRDTASSGLLRGLNSFLSLDEGGDAAALTQEAEKSAEARARQCVEQCRVEELFADTKFLETESLVALMHALAAAAGASAAADSSGRGHGGGGAAELEGALLCNELLVIVTLRNRDRISVIWPPVLSHFRAVLGNGSVANGAVVVERAALGLLGLASRLMPYKEDLREELSNALRLLLALDARVADALMDRIATGLLALVKAVGPLLPPSGWDTVGRLLQASAKHSEAASVGFEALSFCMGEGSSAGDGSRQGAGLLSASNIGVFVPVAEMYAEAQPGGEQRSRRAVTLLSTAALTVIGWAAAADTQNQGQQLLPLWADIVASLQRCCLDERPDVRDEALVSLQRVLLASEPLAPPPQLWASIINGALLPLLDSLISVWTRAGSSRSKNGVFAERSLRLGLGLTSKVILQFMSTLRKLPVDAFLRTWEDILDRFAAAVRRPSDELQEAVPEMLKNILLIMHTTGALGPGDEVLWKATWAKCQSICVDLTPAILDTTSRQSSSGGAAAAAAAAAADQPAANGGAADEAAAAAPPTPEAAAAQ